VTECIHFCTISPGTYGYKLTFQAQNSVNLLPAPLHALQLHLTIVPGTLLTMIFVMFYVFFWEFIFWNRDVDQSKIVMCSFSSFEIGNDFIVSYVRALEEVISSKEPQ
jgi:hypothetical protein